MSKNLDFTVHALLHGKPLCGFSENLPKDWPKDHIWVYPFDVKSITCAECKEEAKKLTKKS